MTADVLIDTNILVYAYNSQADEKHQSALGTLDYWIRTKRAAISTQVLAEFTVVMSSRVSPPLTGTDLLASLDRLSRSLVVLPVTQFIVREATRGMQTYQLSYWDAQIWATARLNQIPRIITEDLPGQIDIEGVRYENPLPTL